MELSYHSLCFFPTVMEGRIMRRVPMWFHGGIFGSCKLLTSCCYLTLDSKAENYLEPPS